jgi:hypothetical protein
MGVVVVSLAGLQRNRNFEFGSSRGSGFARLALVLDLVMGMRQPAAPRGLPDDDSCRRRGPTCSTGAGRRHRLRVGARGGLQRPLDVDVGLRLLRQRGARIDTVRGRDGVDLDLELDVDLDVWCRGRAQAGTRGC